MALGPLWDRNHQHTVPCAHPSVKGTTDEPVKFSGREEGGTEAGGNPHDGAETDTEAREVFIKGKRKKEV